MLICLIDKTSPDELLPSFFLNVDILLKNEEEKISEYSARKISAHLEIALIYGVDASSLVPRTFEHLYKIANIGFYK